MLLNTTSPYSSPRVGLINGATTPSVQPFYGSPRAVTVRNGSYNTPLAPAAVSTKGARNQQRVFGTSPLSGTKGVKNSSYGQNSHTKLYRGGGTKGHSKGNNTQRQHQ
jgi:kinesin family protein 18/19